MRWYPHRTPALLPALFPEMVFHGADSDRTLYLTFDDGPDPAATSAVLDILKAFDATGTFFMVGDRVSRYPDMVARVVAEGHALGNHTYHHLSGWHTQLNTYLNDVATCQEVIRPYAHSMKPLFRPPYGRIGLRQMKYLSNDYRIIMWSLLSGDFDPQMTAERSLRELGTARSGDIIVFHDSPKFVDIVQQVLPEFLKRFHDKGFKFAAIR